MGLFAEKYNDYQAESLVIIWRRTNSVVKELLKIDKQLADGEEYYYEEDFFDKKHKYKLKEVREMLLASITKEEESAYLDKQLARVMDGVDIYADLDDDDADDFNLDFGGDDETEEPEETAEEKFLQEHRKKGDFINFLLLFRDKNPKRWDDIVPYLTTEEKDAYRNKLPPHVKSLAETHKTKGDYAEWLEYLSENDKKRYKYIVENFGTADDGGDSLNLDDDNDFDLDFSDNNDADEKINQSSKTEASSDSEIEEKLAKLKKLCEKGLISEADYNKKKDSLLEDL